MNNPFILFQLKPAPDLRTQEGDILPLDVLKARYTKVQAACHPDSFAMASEAQQKAASEMSSRLNQAYKMLRDDLSRVKTWLALLGLEIENQTTKPDMALFELQMDLEERLAAVAAGDESQKATLIQDIESIKAQALDWFVSLAQNTPDTIEDVEACLNQYSKLALSSRLEQRLYSM